MNYTYKIIKYSFKINLKHHGTYCFTCYIKYFYHNIKKKKLQITIINHANATRTNTKYINNHQTKLSFIQNNNVNKIAK